MKDIHQTSQVISDQQTNLKETQLRNYPSGINNIEAGLISDNASIINQPMRRADREDSTEMMQKGIEMKKTIGQQTIQLGQQLHAQENQQQLIAGYMS